jgi:Family of unknown function (DUF6029)
LSQFNISGSNRAEVWVFKKDYAINWEDKIDVLLKYRYFSGELGMFWFEPSKPWVDPRKPLHYFDYTLTYAPEKFEILVGKYYEAFGRGLVFRTYLDQDFRHDKSMTGVHFLGHLPYNTDIILLGGKLRDVFFQENTYQILNIQDSSDQVYGADVTTQPFTFIGAGGRYLRVNRNSDPTPKAFNELFGADLKATIGPIDLYAEGANRWGTKPGIGGPDRDNISYYLSGSGAFTGFGLVAEFLDYNGIGFPAGIYHYNDPPTPIRSGVAINRGVDEVGFGIGANGSPSSSIFLEGSYAQLKTHDKSSAVQEVIGKGKYEPEKLPILAQAGFESMHQKKIEAGTAVRNYEKPNLDFTYTFGGQDLELELELAWVYEVPEDTIEYPKPLHYHEPGFTLSYGVGQGLIFAFGWQFADQDSLKRYDYAKSWLVLEVAWSINENNILRVRIGSERGGYTCSGGVCRYEAPFTGIKASLVSKF